MTDNLTSFTKSLKKWLQENALEMCIILILVFAAYVNSLPNDFVSDDKAGIVSNAFVRNLSLILAKPINSLGYLIYYITLKIFGTNPVPFRATNILFHLGTALWLYVIVRFLSNKKLALFSAALFAVHPILVEAVTWISAGSYDKYSFFLLGAIATYILSKKYNWTYWVSLFFAFCAMLISEKAIIFPGIMIVLELSFFSLKKNWMRLVPYFLIAGGIGFFSVINIGPRLETFHTDYYQAANQWYNPFQQIPVAITSYLELMIFPRALTLYHTELAFGAFEFAVRFFLTIIFFGLWIISYFRNKFVFFWISLFLIAFIPTMTPIPIAWVVAERYAYLSTAGFVVVASYLIYQTLKWKKIPEKFIFVVFAVIVLSLMTRTIFRNIDWTDEDHLWLAADKYSPHSHNNHNNLGDYYDRHGQYDQAIAEFKKAIEIKPDYADAYHNMANVYKEEGRLDLAMQGYETALKINPTIWQSWHSIAEIYFAQKNYSEALKYMMKADSIDPNNPQILTNIGIIYHELGDNQKTKDYLIRALQIDPTYAHAQDMLNQL